eukprot:1440010-Pleurochrysis_carterae.AAC.1
MLALLALGWAMLSHPLGERAARLSAAAAAAAGALCRCRRCCCCRDESGCCSISFGVERCKNGAPKHGDRGGLQKGLEWVRRWGLECVRVCACVSARVRVDARGVR